VVRSVAIVLLACVVAAAAVLAARWQSQEDEFDRAGARAFVQEALEDAGLEQVEVGERVEATEYRPSTFGADAEPLQVYRTVSQVEGGTVELLVHPESGRPVFLKDVRTDGEALLDDEQYRRLRQFSWTDRAEEAERRRSFGAVGVAALALAAGATVVAARRERMAR
jgi:hypothetical protein